MERYAGGVVPPDYFDRPHGPSARLRHYLSDRDLIVNLDVRKAAFAPPAGLYCCFVIRRRAHGSYRNVPDATVRMVLAKLTSRYDHVFIVGRNIEQFASLYCMPRRSRHVFRD